MPSYDFEVDLQALMQAAEGTAETIQAMRENDVEDFVPTEGMVGHPAVWDAVREFKDRWERGINDMVADVEEVSGRLGKVANTYATFDAEGYQAFNTLTAAIGSDNPFREL